MRCSSVRAAYCARNPPSTGSIAPVIKDARIEHRRATTVGGSVEITATPSRGVSGSRLTFDVQAIDGSGQLVAAGQIDRAVLHRQRFLPRRPQTPVTNEMDSTEWAGLVWRHGRTDQLDGDSGNPGLDSCRGGTSRFEGSGAQSGSVPRASSAWAEVGSLTMRGWSRRSWMTKRTEIRRKACLMNSPASTSGMSNRTTGI